MRRRRLTAHNNQPDAPATRAAGTAFFFRSSPPARSVCHVPGLSIHCPASASTSTLDRDSARQLGPAHPPPPLTHASPLYRIVVSTPPIHCPSFRTLCSPGRGQSQQTARCQRGQHSLGGPPVQTASTGPPEIATLFASHRAHIPVPLPGSPSPRAHASTLIPSDAHRLAEPTALNRSRRVQRRTAHRRPLASPVALTLPLPLALTSQPSQRSTLQPGRFPWLKLLAPGLQEQGQARRYHPMIVAWLGIDLANPVPLSLEQIFNSCP